MLAVWPSWATFPVQPTGGQIHDVAQWSHSKYLHFHFNARHRSGNSAQSQSIKQVLPSFSLSGRGYHFDCTVIWLHFPKLTFGIQGSWRGPMMVHVNTASFSRVQGCCLCNQHAYTSIITTWVICSIHSTTSMLVNWAVLKNISGHSTQSSVLVFFRMVQLTFPWAISVYQ